MQHNQESEDYKPTVYRLQHGDLQPKTLYDESLAIGIITEAQHSDMVHFAMMREAFLTRNEPRSTLIGKLVHGESSESFDGESLADKYNAFLREVPKTTQTSIVTLCSPLSHRHNRKMFYAARDIIQCHLDVFRKWLDAQ